MNHPSVSDGLNNSPMKVSSVKDNNFTNKARNQINILYPEKKKGTWVFTDEEVGLVDEPFVLGTGEIIDSLVKGRTNFKVLISHSYIPKETTVLIKIKSNEKEIEVDGYKIKELGEGWYKEKETGMIGWLCPATLKYFKEYPNEIHIKVE